MTPSFFMGSGSCMSRSWRKVVASTIPPPLDSDIQRAKHGARLGIRTLARVKQTPHARRCAEWRDTTCLCGAPSCSHSFILLFATFIMSRRGHSPPSLWMMQSSRLSPRRCFLGLFLAWKAKPLHLSLILARGKSTSCEHHYVPPAEGPRAQWRSPALRAEGPSLPSAPQPSPTRPCRLAQHRRRCSKRWGATARQQICIPSISADVLFWTNACCNRVRQQRWERMPVPVGELPLHRSLQRHVVNEGPSCHAMRQQSTCVGQ